MTTIHCTGRSAEAARVLIEGSALGRMLDLPGDVIEIEPGLMSICIADARASTLSSGERLLWDALCSFSGTGGGVDVWSCANRLDEPSARALADAVGIALGVGVRA